MQRSTKLLIVILAGIILLLLGLYLLLSPYLAQRAAQSSGQEYSVPSSATNKPKPSSGNSSGAPTNPTQTQTGTTGQAAAKPNTQLNAENDARAAVERVGSGSSQNGFLGYADEMSEATVAFKAELAKEQLAMQQSHPATGALYGVSTRAVSSNLSKGKVGDATLEVAVQAIQTSDAGDPRKPTGKIGKQIMVSLAKQTDGSYLVDGMQWSDLAL